MHGSSVGKEDELRVRLYARRGVKRGSFRNGVGHLVSVEADVCRHLDNVDRVVPSLDGICDLPYPRQSRPSIAGEVVRRARARNVAPGEAARCTAPVWGRARVSPAVFFAVFFAPAPLCANPRAFVLYRSMR